MPRSNETRRHAAKLHTPMVPIVGREFPAVMAGIKREMRWPTVAPVMHHGYRYLPHPAIAFTRATSIGGPRRVGLVVLERVWQEPLDAISPASLEAEGFADIKEFRAYWRYRYKKRYDRYKPTWCFRFHPYDPDEEPSWQAEIYERLILGPFEGLRRGDL